MKLTDYIESTIGSIIVESKTVPSLLTVASCGLFKKVVTAIGGPAYRRHNQIFPKGKKRKVKLTACYQFGRRGVHEWHAMKLEAAAAEARSLTKFHRLDRIAKNSWDPCSIVCRLMNR